MDANKFLIRCWFLEVLLCLGGGYFLIEDGTWWIFDLGLAQATFILLFWGFAWVLGTTGDPKKRKFFTEVPAGKFCLVMMGSELIRVLINVIGHTVESTDNDPFEVTEGVDERGFWDTLSSMIGIRCISLLPFYRLHKMKSEWNEEGKPDPKSTATTFISRSEEIVFFSLQRNYGFVSSEVETGKGSQTTMPGGAPIQSERLPVDIRVLTQTRIHYIFRALILNDWMTVNGAMIDSAMIGFVGNGSVDLLIGQRAEGATGIDDAVVNPEMRRRLLDLAGVENRSCQYKGFSYSGVNKDELQKSSTTRWMKEQEADGAAALIEKPGMAEARVLVEKNKALQGRADILKQVGPEIAGTIAYADNETVTTYAPGHGHTMLPLDGKDGK